MKRDLAFTTFWPAVGSFFHFLSTFGMSAEADRDHSPSDNAGPSPASGPITLHTLGDALIKVGAKEVRHTSPMVFAALLYLCIERGRKVSRSSLRDLFFPEADEQSGTHSVRQLLYKIKQLGVPFTVSSATTTIEAANVIDAADGVLADRNTLLDCCGTSSFSVLPGYNPAISDDFQRWLDEYRTATTARIRAALLGIMGKAHRASKLHEMERAARALLNVDPLNEEATLVLAEAMALSGQKLAAVNLLDEYAAQVGANPSLIAAPSALRKRIIAKVDDSSPSSTPLVGREEELSWLLSQTQRAMSGRPTVSIIWGEAGIGKTRLLRELQNHLALKQVKVTVLLRHQDDAERPLGAMLDMLPDLLESRGALGVAPESLALLRLAAGQRPVGDSPTPKPEASAARLQDALVDIVGSIAGDAALVLLIDNAHWLDPLTWSFLTNERLARDIALHIVLACRQRPPAHLLSQDAERVYVRRLQPLDKASSQLLFEHATRGLARLQEDIRDQCIHLSRGNALHLRVIADHLRRSGASSPRTFGMDELLRQRVQALEGDALLVLRCVAALGNWATQERLQTATGLALSNSLLALQALADVGLITQRGDTLRCFHDLLAELVLAEEPPPIRMALWKRAAATLESDGITSASASLLWSAAEAWRLSEAAPDALRTLKLCATTADDAGQLQLALAALEKAHELAPEAERPPLIVASIRAADVACELQAVHRNVNLLRQYRSPLSPNDLQFASVAEIDWLRRTGMPYWSRRSDLRDIALDERGDIDLRLRAARLLVIAAEQELAVGPATEFFAELRPVMACAANSAEWVHLEMLYHTCFGDVACAEELAHKLLSQVAQRALPDQALTLANVSLAILRNGDFSSAITYLERAIRLYAALKIPARHASISALLAAYLHALGRKQDFLQAHAAAEQLFDSYRIEPTACHIANSIDRAMLYDDDSTARHLLERLCSYPESKSPFNQRSIMAYTIILAQRAGALNLDSSMMRNLETLNKLGRSCRDHDLFALAMFLSIRDTDSHPSATAFVIEYASKWRRERHPLPPYLAAAVDGNYPRRATMLG